MEAARACRKAAFATVGADDDEYCLFAAPSDADGEFGPLDAIQPRSLKDRLDHFTGKYRCFVGVLAVQLELGAGRSSHDIS